ncbi:MAG: DUF1918 domain-containing protein [Acidimicrobiia bacterium]|nr:DUF1918 domain-containing protein [Acidimicrobiia bacterium]
MHANVGDHIVVDATEVGQPQRRGEVVEVRGETGHEHYVVRWEDGHETIFYPGSSAHVVEPGAGR